MLHYLTIPVTPFQQNCSIVWCDQTNEAAVIDPGGDLPLLKAEVARLGVRLKQILLTHAHIDHAGGTGTLARELGLPIIGPHPGDQFWIDGLAQQAKMFGFAPAEPFTADRWLADGDSVTVGQSTLDVRHCPGHSPGHVVFHSAETQRAFVGDVLFAGCLGGCRALGRARAGESCGGSLGVGEACGRPPTTSRQRRLAPQISPALRVDPEMGLIRRCPSSPYRPVWLRLCA